MWAEWYRALAEAGLPPQQGLPRRMEVGGLARRCRRPQRRGSARTRGSATAWAGTAHPAADNRGRGTCGPERHVAL